MTGAEAGCNTEPASPPEEAEPPPALALDLVHESGDWSALDDLEPTLDQLARAIAGHPRCRAAMPTAASVVLSSDGVVRELNRTYRRQDKATNVLSFPLASEAHGSDARALAGDVVLAQETVEREAPELGVPLIAHVQHLIVHGVLHLLGFDHETEPGANDMEATEAEILAALGLPNPYARSQEARGSDG